MKRTGLWLESGDFNSDSDGVVCRPLLLHNLVVSCGYLVVNLQVRLSHSSTTIRTCGCWIWRKLSGRKSRMLRLMSFIHPPADTMFVWRKGWKISRTVPYYIEYGSCTPNSSYRLSTTGFYLTRTTQLSLDVFACVLFCCILHCCITVTWCCGPGGIGRPSSSFSAMTLLVGSGHLTCKTCC